MHFTDHLQVTSCMRFPTFPSRLRDTDRMGVLASSGATAQQRLCRVEERWGHLLYELSHSTAVHDPSNPERHLGH